jgi:hypothetical protein
MGDQQTVSGLPAQTKCCLEQAFGYRKKAKGILSEKGLLLELGLFYAWS